MKVILILTVLMAVAVSQKCCTDKQWLNKQDSDKLVCEENPTEGTGFDAKCKSYTDKSGVAQCHKCDTGFTLSATFTCVADLANCEMQTDSTACMTCSVGYSLESNLCVVDVAQSPVCGTHATSTTCATCVADTSTVFHFLNAAGQCVLITTAIADCTAYTSALMCAQCTGANWAKPNADATLIGTCDPMTGTADANCKTYDSATTCGTCVDLFYLATTCVQTTPIVGCQTYTDAANCKNCKATFYLDATKQCPATATIANCATVKDDKCAKCSDKFHLNSGATGCTANAIVNCTVQSSATVCMTCADKFETAKDGTSCLGCPAKAEKPPAAKGAATTGDDAAKTESSSTINVFTTVMAIIALVLA